MYRRSVLRGLGAVAGVAGSVAAAPGDRSRGSPTPTAVEAVRWFEDYGPRFSADIARAATVDDDGATAVAGISGTFEAGDAWVGRVDADGNRLWVDRYGEGLSDAALDIVQAGDGDGYVVAGSERVSGGRSGWIARIGTDGDRRWRLRTDGDGYETFRSIAYDPETDRYVAAGLSQPGAAADDQRRGLIVAVSSDGDVQWRRRYDADGADTLNHVAVTDDGYLAGGVAGDLTLGTGRAWLVLVDENGGVTGPLESRQYGTDGERQTARTVVAAGDGDGYVLGGGAGDYTEGASAEGLVTAVAPDGTERWSTRLGTTDVVGAENRVEAVSVVPDGYLVLGWYLRESNTLDRTAWLARLDADGAVDWRTALAPLSDGSDVLDFGTIGYSLSRDAEGIRLVGSVTRGTSDGVQTDARMIALAEPETIGRTLQARFDRDADGTVGATELLSLIGAYNNDGAVTSQEVLLAIQSYNRGGRWATI